MNATKRARVLDQQQEQLQPQPDGSDTDDDIDVFFDAVADTPVPSAISIAEEPRYVPTSPNRSPPRGAALRARGPSEHSSADDHGSSASSVTHRDPAHAPPPAAKGSLSKFAGLPLEAVPNSEDQLEVVAGGSSAHFAAPPMQFTPSATSDSATISRRPSMKMMAASISKRRSSSGVASDAATLATTAADQFAAATAGSRSGATTSPGLSLASTQLAALSMVSTSPPTESAVAVTSPAGSGPRNLGSSSHEGTIRRPLPPTPSNNGPVSPTSATDSASRTPAELPTKPRRLSLHFGGSRRQSDGGSSAHSAGTASTGAGVSVLASSPDSPTSMVSQSVVGNSGPGGSHLHHHPHHDDAKSTRSGKSFFSKLKRRASTGAPKPGPALPVALEAPSPAVAAAAAPETDATAPKPEDDASRPDMWWTKAKTRGKGPNGARYFSHLAFVQALLPNAPSLDAPPLPGSTAAASATGSASSPASTVVVSSIWVLRWSPCGRFLASGGKDGVVRIWVIIGLDGSRADEPATPPPPGPDDPHAALWAPSLMVDKPWLELKGHSGDVLDLAWNRRGCIASSSTDKTVRVWHLSQPVAPLAVFAHADFVPSVAFHPTDDWLFTTGCFDGKVRVWSLEDKKLVGSADLAPQYVTSVQFAHDGQWVVAGTYGGHLVVYALDEHGALTVRGQVAIKNGPGGRTGRAVLPMTKDGNLSSGGMTAAAATLAASSTTTATTSTSSTASSRPRKITGIEVWPDPTGAKELLIVSSNDSRIRIVDATDLKVVAKLKGHANKHAQIHGTVAESAIGPRWVFSGSEDGRLYVWDTVLVPSLAPPAMEPPVPGAADGDAADGEGPRSLPPAQQQSKTNTRNRSVSLSTSSRLGRLKHSLFSTSGHDTHRGAALESTSPTTGSFPPTTTVGSPLASVPAATVTLADHEAADVSRCTVTCVASAPLKTRLFLESAGLLPTRWVPPDTVLSSSTTATTPTSAVPTPTLPEPIRNPAEWILTAAADQAGVIRLYINLPAHITLPSPASTLPRSRSIGQEIASAIRRSLSSLTITATTKSGAGDDGQPGPATASTGLRGATSSADLVPVADAPPPVPPLPVLGSGSVGRRAGRRGMVDDPPPPQDASPPDVTATTAVAEGCPYCGSTAFRDLQVIASSESLPNNADESMSPAEGRIVVCCQCLRVVNDSSRVLGQ